MSYPLLLCTYTNVAVDNLVEGLVSAGLKPLRVGFAGKVKPSLLQYTLESEMERHSLRPKYEQLRERIKELEKAIKELIGRLKEYKKAGNSRFSQRVQAMEEDVLWKEKQMGSLDRRAYGLYMTMLRDVVTQADVVRHFGSFHRQALTGLR